MGLVPALCYPRNRINAAPGQLQRPIFGGTVRFFVVSAWGRCPKGLKALLFPVVYAQKSQRKQMEFDNAPLRHVVMKFRPFLGAPMPLTRPNPPEPPGTAGVAMRPAFFRVGVRRSGRVSAS